MEIKKPALSVKKIFILVTLVCLLLSSPWLVETVEKGTYQIKQAAITGTMSAKMEPGIWPQLFGDIDPWPKAETFFFTNSKDTKDDVDADNSIEVRFNDGSVCKISGTARVLLPTSPQDAINLVTERGHKTYKDLEQKLVLPTVRNVLRSTANLMTARGSYNEQRADFINWARDQITNGLYDTDEEIREVEDLVTGEKVRKTVKVIRRDPKTQVPIYQFNPLQGTGIKLDNFEIKLFDYEPKVQAQIAKQQEARMNVETAKAKAEEARQEELRTVAEGKQKVAAAKYEEEQDKVRAVVSAQKDKEVAELQAQKVLEVAKLTKAAAAETKAANILEGQGIAEKNKLILASDGALDKKLAAIVEMNRDAMNAMAKRSVPTNYFASGSGGEAGGSTGSSYDAEMVRTLKMINTQLVQQLQLDATVSK